MDKQTEFVLRTMEERDVRFVRLWFTDVLGTLKSVAIAPAELEGALSEGVGFDGSAIEGFARVYEADMVAHPDPRRSSCCRGGGPGRHGPHVLRHRAARRLAVLRGSAARAQAGDEEGRRHGLLLLRASRDRVLSVPAPDRPGCGADAGRHVRLFRPHHRHREHRLPAPRDHDARADGHLGGVQPPRGRPGPAGDRPALRRCAHHGRQHHDLPRGGERGCGHAEPVRVVYAETAGQPPRIGHAQPRVAVRGRHQRVLRRGGRIQPEQDRTPIRRGSAASRGRVECGAQPVGEQLQAPRGRR